MPWKVNWGRLAIAIVRCADASMAPLLELMSPCPGKISNGQPAQTLFVRSGHPTSWKGSSANDAVQLCRRFLRSSRKSFTSRWEPSMVIHNAGHQCTSSWAPKRPGTRLLMNCRNSTNGPMRRLAERIALPSLEQMVRAIKKPLDNKSSGFSFGPRTLGQIRVAAP